MWAYQNMFYQIQRKCLALGWLYVCAFLPPLLRTVPRKSLNNSTKFYHLVVQSKRVYTYSKSNDDGILQNLKELDYLLLSEKLPAALSFMQNDVMLWSNTIHAISIVCNTEILFLTLWLAAGLSRKTWIWSLYFSHFITIWFALFFANIRLSSLPLCHLYLESPRHSTIYGEKCPKMEG